MGRSNPAIGLADGLWETGTESALSCAKGAPGSPGAPFKPAFGLSGVVPIPEVGSASPDGAPGSRRSVPL